MGSLGRLRHWTYSIAIHAGLALAAFWALSTRWETLPADNRDSEVALQLGRTTRRSKAVPAQAKSAEKTEETVPSGVLAPLTGSRSTLESGESGERAHAFLAQARARIDRLLNYPLALRRRGVQGTVLLALALSLDDGRLLRSSVERSSGSPELDRLALESAQRASPFGRPMGFPDGGSALELKLPVEFHVD